MKLVVDAQPLLGQRAGIGAYVYEVLKRLPALFEDDEICLTLFRFMKRPRIPEEVWLRNVTVRLHRFFPRRVLEGSLKAGYPLPFSWFSGGGDAFLFPNFITYPTDGKPSILILYDLSYDRLPNLAERKNQAFLSKFVPLSLRQATAVITISEFSRGEIADVYGIPLERIRVAYPGVDPAVFRPDINQERTDETLARYHLPAEYILFIGTLEPRKGIEALLEAYETWGDRDKPPLVLVGKRGWGAMPRLARALSGGIPRVFYPGYVRREDLPVLLANARCFVYPSVYEGFGMPVLEALACGVPVVCGTCPSFREIGGDLPTYCDAEKPESIAAALAESLSSAPGPEWRPAAIRRARTFTWENTALSISDVVKAMVGRRLKA